MILHDLFGRHLPDHKSSRWDRGEFTTTCTICGKAMIKRSGLEWSLKS